MNLKFEKSPSISAENDRKPQDLSPHQLRCLSIVVPVYNEVHTFREVLKRIQSVDLPKEIIIVDDFSTDGTRELLQKLEEEQNRHEDRSKLIFVFQPRNMGKGAALRAGIQHATGDLLIVQDADMEYNPSEYPILLEPILSGDADVVFGSRFRGERRKVLLFWHTIGNKFLTLLSNMCTNLNLSDMETCYKVFKTEIIKSIPLRSNRFGFEPEVTAKIAKLRCRIYEIPISYNGRSYSEGKKINWKDGFSAIYTILKYWLVDDLYEETAGLRTLRIMEGAGDYNRWLFSQCKGYLGQRILEVGAGIGNNTKFLADRNLVIATDTVPFYIEELKRGCSHLSNVRIEKLDLLDSASAQEISSKYRPDSVLSMNVLEHIEDDKSALKNMNVALAPGGKLVMVIPAHSALYSKMDKHLGHFRRYTKEMMNTLLPEAGFEILEMRYINMLGAIGWWVNGRLLQRKLIPSRQVRLFDILIKLLSVEKWIKCPFGLSLLVVAKKKS